MRFFIRGKIRICGELFVVSAMLLFGVYAFESYAGNVTQDRHPLVVLQESNPWPSSPKVWALNSLNPVFVLYDDGLVIFKKGRPLLELYSVKLTADEMKIILETLKIGDDFFNLKDFYAVSNMLDQPVYVITSWQGGNRKDVRVYGDLRTHDYDSKDVPLVLLQLVNHMIVYDHPRSQLLLPEKLEVRLYPYTNVQGDPVLWPKGWPDLSDKNTKKNQDNQTSYSYSVYLDGEDKGQLERMLFGLKEKQAVSIGDQLWFLAPQRFCIPGERLWMDHPCP